MSFSYATPDYNPALIPSITHTHLQMCAHALCEIVYNSFGNVKNYATLCLGTQVCCEIMIWHACFYDSCLQAWKHKNWALT